MVHVDSMGSAAPVSYTHLDVYKRQLLGNATLNLRQGTKEMNERCSEKLQTGSKHLRLVLTMSVKGMNVLR